MHNYMVGVLAVAANVIISAGTAAAVTLFLNTEDQQHQTPSMSDVEVQRLVVEQIQALSHHRPNEIATQVSQRQREAEAEAQRQREAEVRRAPEPVELGREAGQAQALNSFTKRVRKLVEQAWIIPPGASTNAAVTLNIQLGPSGEVLGASVVSSSGDDDFDRSAQQAVEQAAPFSEIRDFPAEFQRKLRQFTLRFTPPKDQ